MVDKRSLGDALFTPDKMAFINGGDEQGGSESRSSGRKVAPKTIDLGPAVDAETEDLSNVVPSRQRRQRPRATEAVPSLVEVLDDVLVPLTTRVPHRLNQMLRRFCLEQELRYAKPDSIQAIVKSALEEWFAKRPN